MGLKMIFALLAIPLLAINLGIFVGNLDGALNGNLDGTLDRNLDCPAIYVTTIGEALATDCKYNIARC